MIHPRYSRLLAYICVMLFLDACILPAPQISTSPVQNHAYTAAAATIAAQLTGIVNSKGQTTVETSSAPAMQTIVGMTPTETLPSTSTPLPTKTAIPSDTPPPSVTLKPTSTPSQTPINPAASLGDPKWTDSFTDGNNWPLYNDQHITMEVDAGALRMTALIPNRENPWDGWMVSQPHLINFYLTVAATPRECSRLDRYGMLTRAAPDASRSYLFGFSCDGQYSLRIWNGQTFIILVEWTSSQFIHPGADQTNRLGFKADGNHLSLYANGNLLTELEDDTFSEGAFGLFIGAVDTAGFTVQFDEMVYWELP